jgi:hypothetical protein
MDSGKKVGREENVENNIYVLLSRHQNAGENRDISTANRSVGNEAYKKYFGTTVSNQNLIQEEFERRKVSGNAC